MVRNFVFLLLEFDECVLIEHGCEHNCINTLGGFECSCKPGYELHSDGKHCEGELRIIFDNRVLFEGENPSWDYSNGDRLELPSIPVNSRVFVSVRCLRRSVRGQQRNHHESLVSGNISGKQELRLGNHSSASVSHHAEFHAFRSGRQQCSSTGMRVRLCGSEQQTWRRYPQEARHFLRHQTTVADHLGGQLSQSDFHVR